GRGFAAKWGGARCVLEPRQCVDRPLVARHRQASLPDPKPQRRAVGCAAPVPAQSLPALAALVSGAEVPRRCAGRPVPGYTDTAHPMACQDIARTRTSGSVRRFHTTEWQYLRGRPSGSFEDWQHMAVLFVDMALVWAAY